MSSRKILVRKLDADSNLCIFLDEVQPVKGIGETTMASIGDEFLDRVPEGFLSEAFCELQQSYAESPGPGITLGLDDDRARWLLPLCRRASFDRRLLALASKYSSRIAARTAFASDKNTPYTVLEVGGFFLTASHLDRKGPLPPEAGFRTSNASLNYGLFADLYEPDDGPRYAILTHRSTSDGRGIKSAHIVFPDAAYKGFITRIDLLARYSVAVPATVHTPVKTPVEEIKDERQPVLKKKSGQKRKAQ